MAFRFIALWYIGITSDFGSEKPSSTLGWTTKNAVALVEAAAFFCGICHGVMTSSATHEKNARIK